MSRAVTPSAAARRMILSSTSVKLRTKRTFPPFERRERTIPSKARALRACPTWDRSYTVTPQEYMRTSPDVGVKSSLLRVMVLKILSATALSSIRPPRPGLCSVSLLEFAHLHRDDGHGRDALLAAEQPEVLRALGLHA